MVGGARHVSRVGAALGGHVECLRLLLEKGAAVDRANEWGDTPLFIAKALGHSSIVALLKKHRK